MTVDISDPMKRAARDAWVAACERLIIQIEQWAHQLNWSAHRAEIGLDEPETGPYNAPTLHIRLEDRKELNVTPIARNLTRGIGRVDMEGWPSLHRVRFIYHADDSWSIITDSNVQIREPWNRDAFANLAHDLTSI